MILLDYHQLTYKVLSILNVSQQSHLNFFIILIQPSFI